MNTSTSLALGLASLVALIPSDSFAETEAAFVAQPAEQALVATPQNEPQPSPASSDPSSDPEGDQFTLERSLAWALDHNFDIRKARERIEAQHGVVIEARSRFLPELDVIGRYDRTDKDRLDFFQGRRFGVDKSWALDLRVSYPLFSGGRDLARTAQQYRLLEAVRQEFLSVVNDVLLDVSRRYFEVLLSRRQLEVQQQNVALLEEELKIEKNRLHAGTVSQFNVLRAEVALANSHAPLIRTQNFVRITLEEFSRILGFETTSTDAAVPPVKVAGELSPVVRAIALDEALATAIRKRPELRQREEIVQAQERGVYVARSEFLPSLDVYGSYGRQRSRFPEAVRGELEGWQAGAEVRWNLFNGLATSGRIAQARSSRNTAQLDLQEARARVNVEVRRAYSTLKEAEALLESSRLVVNQAEESLRLARARFDAGVSPQLEVLDTQVALTQARTNEAQARFDYVVAEKTLQRAVGTLVGTATPENPEGGEAAQTPPARGN